MQSLLKKTTKPTYSTFCIDQCHLDIFERWTFPLLQICIWQYCLYL